MIEPSVGRQQRGYRNRWVVIGAVLLAAALFVVMWGVSLLGPESPSSTRVSLVRVRVGETASQVGTALQRRGIIQSALAFDLFSRYNGVATHLSAGVYRVSPRDSLSRIMARMRAGDVVVVKVTIPEGFTVQQIAWRLVQHHIGTTAQFRTLEHQALPGMPKPQAGVRDPLEGYLFPATYSFSYGTGARQALEVMWQTFDTRMIQGVYRHAHTHLTLVQWVTLASIVQGEVKDPSQAADTAAVFINRYKAGMRFQSDATVKYAIGGMPPGGLRAADLKSPSPYNTYGHPGFPPGPIDNPGLTALKAALHPAHVNYLYFVSLPSGRLVFSASFRQQLLNIQHTKTTAQG